MPLSSEDLIWVRRWVGDQPADAVLNAAYDRLLDRGAVAREVLDTRLANFVRSSASLSIPGDVAYNNAKNIDALQDMLVDLETELAAGGDVGGPFTRIIPPPPRRKR